MNTLKIVSFLFITFLTYSCSKTKERRLKTKAVDAQVGSLICQIKKAFYENENQEKLHHYCIPLSGFKLSESSYIINLPDHIKNQRMKFGEKMFVSIKGAKIIDDKILIHDPESIKRVSSPEGYNLEFKQNRAAGSKKVIVVLAYANDEGDKMNMSDVYNAYFGDTNSARYQLDKMSFGKLSIDTSSYGQTPGIFEVTLDKKLNYFVNHENPWDAMREKVKEEFEKIYSKSITDDTVADYIVYCVHKDYPGNAWAFLDAKESHFSGHYCTRVATIIHELGHNFGFGHSGSDSNDYLGYEDREYGDGTCLMGAHDYKTGFNGMKNWYLKWFEDKEKVIEDLGPNENIIVKIAPITDYSRASDDVFSIIKVGNYFLQFNKDEDFVDGTGSMNNTLTVVEEIFDDNYLENNGDFDSYLHVGLSKGDYYEISDYKSGESLFIKVCSVSYAQFPSDKADIMKVAIGYNLNNLCDLDNGFSLENEVNICTENDDITKDGSCLCTNEQSTPKGTSEDDIWGTDIYTNDSNLCLSAVHAGMIEMNKGGIISYRIKGPQLSFNGSSANNITSQSYGEWEQSFSFIEIIEDEIPDEDQPAHQFVNYPSEINFLEMNDSIDIKVGSSEQRKCVSGICVVLQQDGNIVVKHENYWGRPLASSRTEGYNKIENLRLYMQDDANLCIQTAVKPIENYRCFGHLDRFTTAPKLVMKINDEGNYNYTGKLIVEAGNQQKTIIENINLPRDHHPVDFNELCIGLSVIENIGKLRLVCASNSLLIPDLELKGIHIINGRLVQMGTSDTNTFLDSCKILNVNNGILKAQCDDQKTEELSLDLKNFIRYNSDLNEFEYW